MDFKGSETEQNLLKAFTIEAQLRNIHDFYRQIAQKDGYDYISSFFEKTSNNKKEHAKLWYKWAKDSSIEHTAEALEDIIKGKYAALSKYYEVCSQKAKQEGFEHIADLFKHIAEVEKSEQEMFSKLLASIKDEHIKPDKNGNYRWECSVCGAYFEQPEMPDHCPLCLNEDIFFFKVPFDKTGDN